MTPPLNGCVSPAGNWQQSILQVLGKEVLGQMKENGFLLNASTHHRQCGTPLLVREQHILKELVFLENIVIGPGRRKYDWAGENAIVRVIKC